MSQSGHNLRPEDVAKLRATWPNIVKEVGKLEDRLDKKIPIPKSIEDVILAVTDKKNAEIMAPLKNINLSAIPLTDDFRQILKDLGTGKP